MGKSRYSKALPNNISASSKVSVKLGDNFYTVEYSESRTVDDTMDIDFEREKLWDVVHNETDRQIEELVKLYRENRRKPRKIKKK